MRVDVVLDLVGLAGHLAGADLVVTGEGQLDARTLHGKAPAGVARRARAAGVPVVAVAGAACWTTRTCAGQGSTPPMRSPTWPTPTGACGRPARSSGGWPPVSPATPC